MTTVNIDNPVQAPAAPAKGIQVTDKALARIRAAMAKENISPAEGGLRLGVQGGGCSGLSYNIRFDTQPRERDRVFHVRRRSRVCRSEVVHLPARHDSGLRRDLDAPRLRLPQSECQEIVRLRHFVLVMRDRLVCSSPFLG